MSTYMSFQSLFIWLPTLLLLWLAKGEPFRRYRKTMLLAMAATVAFGVPWDALSVVTGLWRYDTGQPSLGPWLGPLPLEEYVFTATFPVLMVSFVLLLRRVVGRESD